MSEWDEWLANTAWDKHYWTMVAIRAAQLKSDGCTGVVDFYKWTCLEHDIHYRTHKTLFGTPISFETANYMFRVRIQQASKLGKLSPMSWIRWLGVTWFGKQAWLG